MSYDVVGIGACAVDYSGVIDSYPEPDTKNKIEQMHCQGGGPVATALVALARLGARVSYLGKLGDDALSQFAWQEFVKEGVDTGHIIKERDAGPYFAFIVADRTKGERTIWWTDQDVSHLKPEDISKKFITSAKFLHLDEYEMNAGLQAAVWAKEAGVRVVLDAETPDKEGMEEIIKLTDVLIIPDDFAFRFTGRRQVESAAEELFKLGPEIIAVTRGEEDCFCRTGEGEFYQPIFKVEVVDTTGCGDVFHGAFIYGLLRDWPLMAVVEFASAVSALKCRKLGGRSGIPNLREVRAFLLERGSSEIRKIIG